MNRVRIRSMAVVLGLIAVAIYVGFYFIVAQR